jgi:hypothetical protein
VYPHALPLVVSIEKLATQTARPARASSEILLGNPEAIRKLARRRRSPLRKQGWG